MPQWGSRWRYYRYSGDEQIGEVGREGRQVPGDYVGPLCVWPVHGGGRGDGGQGKGVWGWSGRKEGERAVVVRKVGGQGMALT